MLYYVSGPVTVLEPGLAVIDCGGVGYGCRITTYTAAQLKLNTPAKLYVTESIKEDAYDIYGFSTREEQRCYELLTAVNGVGPKAALSILSSGGPQNFTLAVMTGDEKMLTAAQGIGKKIAQRIILELKDKLSLPDFFSEGEPLTGGGVPTEAGGATAKNEAIQALVALGYSNADAVLAVKKAGDTTGLDTEGILKLALKQMALF